MRRFLAAMLPAVLGGCAATPGPPIDVAVTKSGESWYADFHFPRRARAWGSAFSQATLQAGAGRAVDAERHPGP